MKLKREKSTTTIGHYVRNADLLPEIISCKEKGKVSNKLILMIKMMAERYSLKSSFARYSFREDMIATAVTNLCRNALKFDHENYSNPFAFYTTAIHNSFLQYLAEEKKHRQIRDTLILQAGSNPSFNFGDNDDGRDDLEIEHRHLDISLGVSDADENTDRESVSSVLRKPGEVVKLKPNEVFFDEKQGIYVKKT